MKTITKLLICILIGFSIGIIVRQAMLTAYYKKVEGYEIIGKIKITEDFINVREEPTSKSKKIYEVLKDEKYEIVEIFEEETGVYDWYKIVFGDRRVGWVASYREVPWVEEIK